MNKREKQESHRTALGKRDYYIVFYDDIPYGLDLQTTKRIWKRGVVISGGTDDEVFLSAQEALELGAWLTAEKETLEQLVREQQAENM